MIATYKRASAKLALKESVTTRNAQKPQVEQREVVLRQAIVLGVLGAILFALGLPLSGYPPDGIGSESGLVLGEPCILLGAVLIVVSRSVAQECGTLTEDDLYKLVVTLLRFTIPMATSIFLCSAMVLRFGVGDPFLQRPVIAPLRPSTWVLGSFFGLVFAAFVLAGWITRYSLSPAGGSFEALVRWCRIVAAVILAMLVVLACVILWEESG